MTTDWKEWEHSLSTTSVAAPPFEAPSFDQATGRAGSSYGSYGKLPGGGGDGMPSEVVTPFNS